ncbi:MAG: hypothetical protein EHM58_03255 [Ignavibacteriae bacterium]|nr:MAG: hypothetical protein EHM58_03255 [Ignavibacteriota bacterium]
MIVNNIIRVAERLFNSEEIDFFELKKKEIIVYRKDYKHKTHLRFNREEDAELAFLSIPEELRKINI